MSIFGRCELNVYSSSVVLRCLDGSDQNSFNLNAVLQNCFVICISALQQQLQPVFTFRAFFQCDIEFIQKVLSAASVLRFRNIRTNTGTAAQKLFGQDIFLFLVTPILTCKDDPLGTGHAFHFDLILAQFLIPHCSFLIRISGGTVSCR